MGELGDLESVYHALVQQWGVSAREPGPSTCEALLEALTRRVDFLLRHDFERLMTGMYMLDVSEEKFAVAVQRPAHEKPARILAEMILEREIEKMQTRQRYAQRGGDDEAVENRLRAIDQSLPRN